MSRLVPSDGTTDLLAALNAMLADPGRKTFTAAAAAFDAAAHAPPARLKRIGSVRLHLYAALSGNQVSVSKVAAYAVELAYAPGLEPEMAREIAAAASAWLLAATGKAKLPRIWTRRSAQAFLERANAGAEPGPVEHMLRSRRELLASVPVGPMPCPTEMPTLVCGGVSRVGNAPAAVVLTSVGNAGTAEGRRVASEFEACLGQALRLCPVPDLVRVRQRMLGAFPYAANTIDALLGPLAGRQHAQLPPTLIVGRSGAGKSSFAHLLTGELGLPAEIVQCTPGTVLGGNARQWSTGEPSLPVSLIRRYRHAGPAIIIDALDAAFAGQTASALTVALQCFFDPAGAKHFRDPYLETPIDLSHVTWLATATSLEAIPRSIRERWHVVQLPQPRAVDLPPLANALLQLAMERQGLHAAWATPLDGVELEALAKRWPGGSLRHLERYVAAVLAARGTTCERH